MTLQLEWETEIQQYLCLQMPLLSTQFLQKHRELRLAHMALSAVTMGYTWQDGEENVVEVRDVTTSCTFNRKQLQVCSGWGTTTWQVMFPVMKSEENE